MTRINAGSTLANQFAPPFVVSDQVTTNWQLRFNKTLLAFEAFDPAELVIEAGFNEIESQLFIGVTNQQTFVLPWVAASKASLYITIQGVKQHTDTFSITAGANTTTVTLGGPASDDVEFIGLQTTGGVTIELFNGVGDNSTTDFLIGFLAPSEESLLVTIDGIRQHTDTYAIASNSAFTDTTITFAVAPTSGATIEIVGIATTGEIPASPVEIVNLDGGLSDATTIAATDVRAEFLRRKRLSGETQLFDLADLTAGANINLRYNADPLTVPESVNSIIISADQPTFQNLGSGQQAIVPVPGTTDPLTFHSLNGGNRIILALAGGELTWSVDDGYVKDGSTTINAVTGDRLIGVSNTGAPVTVNLLAIAELPAGDTITIKDESGGAATNNITVTPASETIDGNATHVISTNHGYVTLYSDGTNYFIIAEG